MPQLALSAQSGALPPRTNTGGAGNVLLPAFAALAILFGLGLREALVQLQPSPRRGRPARQTGPAARPRRRT